MEFTTGSDEPEPCTHCDSICARNTTSASSQASRSVRARAYSTYSYLSQQASPAPLPSSQPGPSRLVAEPLLNPDSAPSLSRELTSLQGALAALSLSPRIPESGFFREPAFTTYQLFSESSSRPSGSRSSQASRSMRVPSDPASYQQAPVEAPQAAPNPLSPVAGPSRLLGEHTVPKSAPTSLSGGEHSYTSSQTSAGPSFPPSFPNFGDDVLSTIERPSASLFPSVVHPICPPTQFIGEQRFASPLQAHQTVAAIPTAPAAPRLGILRDPDIIPTLPPSECRLNSLLEHRSWGPANIIWDTRNVPTTARFPSTQPAPYSSMEEAFAQPATSPPSQRLHIVRVADDSMETWPWPADVYDTIHGVSCGFLLEMIYLLLTEPVTMDEYRAVSGHRQRTVETAYHARIDHCRRMGGPEPAQPDALRRLDFLSGMYFRGLAPCPDGVGWMMHFGPP
ncbi:hypothetical protein BV25DRAFT_355509 [Artomyces pyxidatus]|uniref:Uncharacterized protein n=1 Tax=Artomyces pyxidatus TaxID=48021 RepID=A0ACB8T6I1_9AGAM|nr:hypothetical protein BV25DRAFT_355509 [Artomyces pyxidatus]